MREGGGGGGGGGMVEGENWFSRWEEDLPSPEELMPLSQTLITPHLALAFDIPTATATATSHHHQTPTPAAAAAAAAADFDDLNCSGGGGGSGAGAGDEPARTLKRPRLVWTPQLHKRFVDAVAHLGIKNAVPKTIMQLMSVDGLTRENVASHLQKYRLYLKRMQGLTSSSSSSAGAAAGPSCSPADAATDQLFATAPIPHHFLRPAAAPPAPPPEPPSFMPFAPATAAALHHHQQMVAAAAAAAQRQYHQRHQMGHFGSPAVGFDHGGFLATGQPPQPGMHRMGPPVQAAASNADGSEEGGRGGAAAAAAAPGGGRKVLTLFPTGEDR